MLFRKKGMEPEAKDIEKIIEEYSAVVKSTIGRYLPRRARRAMSRGKGGVGFSPSRKNKEIEKIKKVGIEAWLDQTTQDTLKELSPLLSDPLSLESELMSRLKEFKKKWNLR
jgi:phage terminase small subunit